MTSLHCLTLLGARDCSLNGLGVGSNREEGREKKAWKGGMTLKTLTSLNKEVTL